MNIVQAPTAAVVNPDEDQEQTWQGYESHADFSSEDEVIWKINKLKSLK